MKKAEELTTRERMCSVVGGMASRFVDRAVPSRLIPFRGEFPLLDEIEARRFREAIRSTMWIEELPPKFLYAAVEGSRMYTLEAKFLKYLWSRALTADDFTKLEAAERSDYFRNWMDTDAVCDEEFVVRKYRDKCQSVPAPFSKPDATLPERQEIYCDLIARRAYWDDLCFEFGRLDWEKKLLNLALYIYYGGDLSYLLERYRTNHPDYADRISEVLAEYIGYLRTGKATSVINCFLLEIAYLSEYQLTVLLVAELRERLTDVFCWDGRSNCAYSIEIDYDGEERLDMEIKKLSVEKSREKLIFGNLTTKLFIMDMKETLLNANPWRAVAEELAKKDYAGRLANNASPLDREAIAAFNEKAKPIYCLHSEWIPEPVMGNFFDAKVAILTLNPGWAESTETEKGNIALFDALSPEAQRKFVQSKAKALALEGDPYPTTDEDINSVDTWYWNARLREVMKLSDDAVNYLTIIQYFGYHSVKYHDMPKRLIKSESGLLPTQEFAVRLVRYLMDRKAVIVIGRSARRWFRVVEGLETYDGLVLLKNYRQTYVTPNNCKDNGFEKIRAALTE